MGDLDLLRRLDGRGVDVHSLAARIDALAATPAGAALAGDATEVVRTALELLESGAVRAAERGADGTWRAVPWVKRAILLAFRAGAVVDMSPPGGPLTFFDKDTLPLRPLALVDGVRVVPGGSSIRRGA